MVIPSPCSSTSDYLQLSLEEILGAEALSGFKDRMQLDPDDLTILGTLHRAGRAGFYYWLQQTSERSWWNDPAFRFSPIKKKITSGLERITTELSAEKDQTFILHNKPQCWEIHVRTTCAEFMNVNYLAGFVQEFASWAGLGKFYRVKLEKEAGTSDPNWLIVLDKNPIDS